MEIDCIHVNSMEGSQDEYAENSPSPQSSDMDDVFGEPEVIPRVGYEYQAEIPPLIAECDLLQLIKIPRNAELNKIINKSFQLGLPIPLMWSNNEAENINGTVEFESSEESQVTSNNEYSQLKVEPVATMSGYGQDSNLQQAAASSKMEVVLALPQESENKIEPAERGFYPLPDSVNESWTDIERDSFILGLYIFGKNLITVKKFVGSKGMGDILSFYYGEFYRSNGYRRWSECQKLRSKRGIHGQKLFTGWRQQELLSRLFPHVSQECQSLLLEVSGVYGEGRISLEDYVFSIKSAVGINMLIEAVGIGKGKQDLTSTTMDSTKSNQVISVHPEIPIGKACSSLTSEDIIKFLTGNFRLSKARSSDLFWEAVWPRLLARGWHSEQPKDHGVAGSKHSLVFLVPGVKKFSRRRHVKGNEYFDSISDVLNKVASDPGLLDIEATEGSQHKEEYGWDKSQKQDQDSLSKKQHNCYLLPHNSNCNRDSQKFTIVDTSLAHGTERPKVRELRSLPIETTSASTSSSLSSETEPDTSEGSEEEIEETNTPNLTGRSTTCANSSDCINILPEKAMLNAPNPTITALEYNEDQSCSPVKDKQQGKSVKYQFSRKKSGCSKYLVPITKQQGFTACDPDDSSCNTKITFMDRKLKEDESHCTSNSPDACEDMVFQVGPPQNLSSASSLAKGSPDGSNEGIVGENCPVGEVSPEKPQSSNLIDLNSPHISPDFAADQPIMTDMAQNTNDSCVNNSSFLSETMQQPEPLMPPDSRAPSGQQLIITTDMAQNTNDSCVNKSSFLSETSQQPESLKPPECRTPPEQQPILKSRRQSTRNRPLTTKALEALELGGFFNAKKKRKASDTQDSTLASRSSRRVRGRANVTASNDGGNDVAGYETEEFLDGLHDKGNRVGESQV